MTTANIPACPIDPTRDDRKSAKLAAQRLHSEPNAQMIDNFAQGRAILRNATMYQAGVGAADAKNSDALQYNSVFFLDGEPHRRRRSAIAKFFTPKAISSRHRVVMERTTDELIGKLHAAGGGQLDELSYQLTVAVAGEIIGLTNSSREGIAKRVEATLGGVGRLSPNPVRRRVAMLLTAAHAMNFLVRDVLPAIRARRRTPAEDVISHLLGEGASNQAILVECMTYAAAGMVTTREFIVMAAWHMFESEPLRERFLTSSEADQILLLEEILRLEPIASMLHRSATEDVETLAKPAHKGDLFAVNVRQANLDTETVGECPFALDPDRAKRQRGVGSYLSFGDGNHRCPGAQVAMAESRLFLDRLMRLPGITMVRTPDITWREDLMSYELRGATLACTKA